MPNEQIQEAIKTANKVRKKLHFIPVEDMVIVYRLKIKTTAGGIHLPDQENPESRGYATTAVVLAVGPGAFAEMTGVLIPMPVESGDYVLISALSGLQLGEVARAEAPELPFEEIRLIRRKDVIAKLDPEYLG
jgi:chaperonin GroES